MAQQSPQPMTRKTKRLTVRLLTGKDHAAWKAGYQEAGAPKNEWDFWRREPSDLTKASFTKFLKTQKHDRKTEGKIDFGIFRNDTGEYIGSVALICLNRSSVQSSILGYYLFNKHWSEGFGREAVEAAIDIAFRDLNLHRLEAPIDPKNKRSRRLAKSLGMRNEGLRKAFMRIHGEWVDHLIYAITSEELGLKWWPSLAQARR